ncbi:EAL domain-containing response regulator [Varunaivibrio sulfuroxidans]|uniref:EAL domain-containing protein (Putative c-di-GMP-specific phosphodiesterase class I) n=1 Tax=Varunaivibrio sulfuroxidans TaxID=1773489 RepID=A0A4R3JAX7_9PROT|nr:EAL domain-containing protein [Varunaivibrio sulfuroxidans]TCS62226.1 EAL domain-containing protein (putative c-di-GMP-specific phosphodiesterase class I) [Varunaivibrio sulfuroxidans]WES30651.1 EAL domain-containing protein [Varunaivibrio sulfuroxidans]
MLLFVDDDPNLLAAFRRNLSMKYDMDIALSGDEALNLIATRGPYAVIISDINMPGMNGVEFLTKAHQIAPKSVKIALSGWGEKDDVIHAINEGHIYRYLTKPIAPANLRDVLDDAIRLFLENRQGTHVQELTPEDFVRYGRDLKVAVEQNQFFIRYQPQINIATGRPHAVEALIRWRHPEHGVIAPAQFIPAAEITGEIIPITQWLLHTVCEDIAQLREQGREIIASANISGAYFTQLDLVTSALNATKSAGIPPRFLELELTETVFIENINDLKKTLIELAKAGFSIALDDFGSGFMGFSYLSDLPVHKLKIDGSFVRHMLNDTKSAAIVKSLIIAGQSIGLGVVAEGIENAQQVEVLKTLGCNMGQGFLYSEALDFDALSTWLSAPENRPEGLPKAAWGIHH